MIVTIQPSSLSGIIQSPASKSSMQRACAAALLTKGTSVIRNPGHSNDDKAALDVIQTLGATSEFKDHELKITGRGFPAGFGGNNNEVNCGESGLGIRMFAPIIALSKHEIIINGEGSLMNRPMDFFDDVFPQLSISIKSNKGKLPLRIRGPLHPENIEIDGSLSSQFLTGLLMAYVAAGAEQVSIKVNNLKSKPYIDLTLEVMKVFGMPVPENNNYEEFYFPPNGIRQTGNETIGYTVEGDWSGGAFLLVAGAIAGKIMVKGLDSHSSQADKLILQTLMSCGAEISVEPDQIEIGPASLRSFHFDATECPDLFPPLVSLASYCNGITTIAGVSRLAYKESNRAIALKQEFGKLGVQVDLDDDLMIIYGGGPIKGAQLHSHHDHRIAMACAVAALKAEGQSSIEEADAINKSYPDFYEHIQSLGAKLVVQNSALNVP